MFKKVENKKSRLYERIIDEINKLIDTGQLQPGDYLPSERDLAEMLGVSRVPVREAIKTLEFMGVLKNNSKGVYVAHTASAVSKSLQLVLDGGHDAFEDLIEMREFIESKAVELACQRRTDEDLEEMDIVLKRMEEETESDSININTSKAFHLALLRASKNSVLTRIVEIMDDLLYEVRERTLITPGRAKQSYEEQCRIVVAIRQRDVSLACKEMLEHIKHMRSHYTDYSNEDVVNLEIRNSK